MRCLIVFALTALIASPVMAVDSLSSEFTDVIGVQPYAKIKAGAERGDPYAQSDLAYLYYKSGSDPGIRGIPHNKRRAAHWYRKAAEQGHSSAQYNLAVLYLNGHGVDHDPIAAYAWLTQASGRGHGNSEDLLVYLRTLMDEDQIERGEVAAAELVITDSNS